jgi:hypothetical protein
MFTTRRRPTRSRSSWSRKKPRRLPSLPILLLMAVGGLLGLELLFRAIAGLTGFSAASNSNSLTQAYQLRFLSPEGQPYRTLPSVGKLAATRDPLLGYQLQPKQSNPHWSINAQGFRDPDEVPLQKPNGEVRIFVLGGSAAFGQLSKSDKTLFAHQLETKLNQQVADQKAKPNAYQPETLPYTYDDVNKVMKRPVRLPDRQYRVVNAAVPGYVSGNDMVHLMAHVSRYSPDVVVLLNGYDDLLLPSSRSGVEVPLEKVLTGQQESWGAQAMGAIGGWLNNLYVVKVPRSWFKQGEKADPEVVRSLNLLATSQPLAQSFAANSSELDLRIARYQNHLQQMVRWSTAAKKRLVIALQPEVSAVAKPSPEETAMLKQLGQNYPTQVKAGYDGLAAAAKAAAGTQAKVVNFQKLEGKGNLFISPTSLTDAGHQALAERLYKAIAADLALKPKPFQ